MKIILASIDDIKKYDPYTNLSVDQFIDDNYFELKFIEYFNDFNDQISLLKSISGHKNDLEIDDEFSAVIKRRNDELISNVYDWCHSKLTIWGDYSCFDTIRMVLRKIKELILISEQNSMKRLQKIDGLFDKLIDDASLEFKMNKGKSFDGIKIENFISSFVEKTKGLSDECEYFSCIANYRETLNKICNYYGIIYSVDKASEEIKKITKQFEDALDDSASKLGFVKAMEGKIDLIAQDYEKHSSLTFYYRGFINQARKEIEDLKATINKNFSKKTANKLLDLLEKKIGSILDRKAIHAGMPVAHELSLSKLFENYKPENLDIFDWDFYSDVSDREKAVDRYSEMTEEERHVFEMRIYDQYIRIFKAKIRELNNEIRMSYSKKLADKMIALNNKKADQYICKKAKEIGKPIPKNPWFIRKYLWSDLENFATPKGVKFRKIIGPLMRFVVELAMKNDLIIEERSKLDKNKQYVFVPTHYFGEDIIGLYASLGRSGYTVIGTTDQIENNFLMLAAIALGLIYVDRGDSFSRKECVEKQNRIIDLGSSVTNYVGGSWEISENELQPLSFSGPYRTAKAKGVQIVPVGLYYQQECGKIYVRFGDAIDVSKMKEDEANDVIRDSLASIHFKQISKYSKPIETIKIDGYGKTHNLPYEQHIYHMENVADEYWGQYWSKPFAKEEIGLRSSKNVSETDVYSFVDNLSRDKLIELSDRIAEPLLRRYQENDRYNMVKYIDENYDRLKKKHNNVKTKKKSNKIWPCVK